MAARAFPFLCDTTVHKTTVVLRSLILISRPRWGWKSDPQDSSEGRRCPSKRNRPPLPSRFLSAPFPPRFLYSSPLFSSSAPRNEFSNDASNRRSCTCIYIFQKRKINNLIFIIYVYTYGDLIFREQYRKNISRYIKRNFIYLILRKKESKGGFSMKKIIFVVDEDVDRFLYSFSSGLLLLVFLIWWIIMWSRLEIRSIDSMGMKL